MGIISLSVEKNTEDGPLLRYVINQGGIPFIKTNIPMFLKTIESCNNIYGRAKNPWNLARTPGGSSGGESCVISALCSPGGIGGDIGGSVRTPCAYTAIWGIKPSSRRTPYIGNGKVLPTHTKCRLGQRCIIPVGGPLARSVDCVVR